MDNTIEGYKSAANTASANLADLQGSAPGMLAELKKNLVGIFAKDNPIIQARGTALEDYLNSTSKTQADILTPNLPMVEGSNLTLSPTQQNAIVTARQNAALVPLAGLNQIVTGQYGTIGDIVQGAASGYNATVDAAKTRVSNLIDLYKTAVAEQESRNKAVGSGGLDLAGIIAAIRASMGTNAADGRPPLDAFDEPDNFTVPDILTGAPTALNLNVPAVPKQTAGLSQPLNLNGYNLNNFSLNRPTASGLSIPGIGNSPFAGLGIKLGGGGYGF